ncbi:uncharacterized protein LOC121874099 isoform X3 [Homarus americanus]|uniref:uncharacterized protein LOC121874099 isoform X3 n=1 Tax=Homarus americanus TaxID=6706 RepID=UPI001C4931FD|nr:uncharacterized protein LOC121874099 isoform X3 [Homarus americanus]
MKLISQQLLGLGRAVILLASVMLIMELSSPRSSGSGGGILEAVRQEVGGVLRPPDGPYYNDAKMCFTPALESIEEFFTYIRTPTAHCRTSARLGGVKTRQGVYNLKWVCLDSKYHIKRDSCLVFSFGMDSNGEFENDIMRLVGCKVYVFDPSITQDTHTINIHVLDVGVADYTGTMLIGWRFYPLTPILKRGLLRWVPLVGKIVEPRADLTIIKLLWPQLTSPRLLENRLFSHFIFLTFAA